MNITVWDIFHYIFKWKWLIILVTVGSIVFAVRYTDTHQTYDAKTVIKYNDSCISEGKTPNNDDFDPYEVVSPDIITSVIKELSLERSVDSIRSKVEITGIVPEAEAAMKESKTKEGKEYSYFPNTFTIKYSGAVGESETQVIDILDSIVQNYLDAYNANYISQMAIDDVTFEDNIGAYDYIEAINIMDTRIDKIIAMLNNYYIMDTTFRSPKTGLTFSDIQKEYEHLQEYTVAKIMSNIFAGQITKNKTLLLEKYEQRKDEYNLQYVNFSDKAQTAKERMDAFVNANINVPNSYNRNDLSRNNDDLDVLRDVYDYWRVDPDSNRDVTTTFDVLILGYVDASIAANNAKLNADFCDKVMSKFTGERDSSIDVNALAREIGNDIAYTKTQMNELYKKLSVTIDDFNDMNVSRHISQLVGVQYYNTKSLSLYLLVFTALGLMLSVLFAITFELCKTKFSIPTEPEDEAKDEEDAPSPAE